MKCYYCETEPINSTTNKNLKVCNCYRLHQLNGTETQYYSSRQDEIDHLRDQVDQQKAEIEELQKKNDWFSDLGKMYGEIKIEAYKKFAKRLIEIGKQDGAYDYVSLRDIDNLLKEMVGEW